MAITGRDGNQGSIVSGSSITAAGLASALAAAVTSSVGWAGGLLGAALTTMIIIGGSAIPGAYLQSAKSRVQAAPGISGPRRSASGPGNLRAEWTLPRERG